MKERCFCTIITHSHLGWALALIGSLRSFDPDLPFAILITDRDHIAPEELRGIGGVEVVHCKDLRPVGSGARIMERYAHQSDELRWSLKGVLMEHLLQRYEKVIYGDCDLHFFSDPAWLWHELTTSSMLLTPHWRSSDATVDRENFDMLFVDGLYNAGFVGASRSAIPALRRWSANCSVICVKDSTRGQFVDQTHLNVLPIYFDGVQVLKHRGCNVANWNMVECARTATPDGSVLINGMFPVVFIHFTRSMIDGIVSGKDHMLAPHLATLRDRLLQFGFAQDVIEASEARAAAKQATLTPSLGKRLSHALSRLTGRSGSR
jgi:hypothetical protein